MTPEKFASQTRFRLPEAQRIVAALEGVPEHFLWAMVQAGHYSADEIVERLGALKTCMKKGA